MAGLDVTALSNELRPTGVWTAALLHALARDEAAGRRPQRLTEVRLDTWRRFKGRLGTTDLLALLFEDASVLHRVPFDAEAVGGPLRLESLPETVTGEWIAAVQSVDLNAVGTEYIVEQARRLGVPTRLARSDLHVVKAHHKVLELPGTGGQLAHHLVSTQPELTVHDNFVIACGSWQELTLAGIVALDLNAPHSDFVSRVEVQDLHDLNHPLRQRSFDFVIGLHPEKGGALQIEEQLAIWFPTPAKILLV